jgi:hypothetical protein
MQVDTDQAGWETQRAFPFHGASVAPYSGMGFAFHPLVQVDVPCGPRPPPPPSPRAPEFEEAAELGVEDGAQLRATQRLFDLLRNTTTSTAEQEEKTNSLMQERVQGGEERDVAGRRRRRRRRRD